MPRPKKAMAIQKKNEDVKKWFKSGPVQEITREDWFKMHPIHRHLYNAYKRKEQLEKELEIVTGEIKSMSVPIMEAIKNDPNSIFNDWAWIETMHQSKPKWKEIAISINEKKALKLAKEYLSKKFPFLRIKFIHPNKD
jgi:hypothetical protein